MSNIIIQWADYRGKDVGKEIMGMGGLVLGLVLDHMGMRREGTGKCGLRRGAWVVSDVARH